LILSPTRLTGVLVVELELLCDERGFFARTFDRAAFVEAGLDPIIEQCNLSYNRRAGTVRGMHYQGPPGAEAKLVRCTAGAILDTVVDVRYTSPTYLESFSVELSAANRKALYVPPMFAHGFQTLLDSTEVAYQMSQAYAPGTDRGLRHDDPALGLRWPLPVTIISARDTSWPLLTAQGSP